METFTASRLTSGNRIFRSKISIDQLGVTLKIPGLFSGDEKTVPYSRISSVNTICPFVGYSTIIIETTGEGSINTPSNNQRPTILFLSIFGKKSQSYTRKV